MIFEVRIGLVFWRVYAAVMKPYPGAPAVIGDDLVLYGALVIEPGEELGRLPEGIRTVPVAVRPEDLGMIGIDQVLHLGPHIVGYIGRLVLCKDGVVPFVILPLGAPSRYGVYTPMNKDAKLGILEPLRYGPLIKGFPGRLIGLGPKGADQAQRDGRQSEGGKQDFFHVAIF